jgi:hypothetical protein
MYTKIQAEIMKVFTSKINEDFSIKQISEILKKPYPLMHRAIQELINQNYLLRDKRKIVRLNYKDKMQEIAYIENLRAEERLNKDKVLKLFVKDILDKIKEDYFIFLIFGSYIDKKSPRDLDLLLILNNKDNIEHTERFIKNIASNFSYKFDVNVIATESAYEMIKKASEKNIMNETLNKHLIIFGAENYYRILKNAR